MEAELRWRWSITYADAESILARIHRAVDVQRGAFRGRLKHLKRLGIPLDSSPGRGAKIWYFEDQMWQWALALELAEFGMDPAVIVALIKQNWTEILPRFHEANRDPGPNASDDLLLILRPNLMQTAWTQEAMNLQWLRTSKLQSDIFRVLMGPGRSLIVNVSELCRQMGMAQVAVQSSRKPGGSVGNNS